MPDKPRWSEERLAKIQEQVDSSREAGYEDLSKHWEGIRDGSIYWGDEDRRYSPEELECLSRQIELGLEYHIKAMEQAGELPDKAPKAAQGLLDRLKVIVESGTSG